MDLAEVEAAARAAHTGQTDKAAGPYAEHLQAVAEGVRLRGGDDEQIAAAWLHDAVEDQGGLATQTAIAERFGPSIAGMVAGCSDSDDSPKPPWRVRKEQYIARLHTATPSVRLIAAADKLHNIRSLLADYRRMGGDLWQHFRGGREGTLWYYRAVVNALRAHDDRRIVDELEQAVSDFERAVE